ncbi:heme exporter protein CcmD [Thermomonas sp.]|uniref:heme exporter protein CcmD n=1 Tax=Thermomonas sp. TaxID=1971895 RepID=UPI00391B4920
MSYREYVIAAYAVFAAMLLWDWLVPTLQIRAALRAATRRLARRKATPSPNPELPLSRD